MGKLTYLILHNADTPSVREVTKEDIEQWHLKERGWSRVGYSKLFQRSGNVIDFYDIDHDQWITANEITNGASGYNGVSVHWCFAGGKTQDGKTINGTYRDVLTDNQLISFKTELYDFLKYHPDVIIIGHNQVSQKYCPGFKVSELLKSIGIQKRNIKEGKIQ